MFFLFLFRFDVLNLFSPFCVLWSEKENNFHRMDFHIILVSWRRVKEGKEDVRRGGEE
jgi:hypothetical protein